jgi:4a-hydroxytetrahydrobiopterin dehydratase
MTGKIRKGAPLLAADDVARLHKDVPLWKVADGKRLEREFRFKDFRSALAFANRVGELSDAENHHPDILIAWGKVAVVLWTHSAGGITENDFVLAGKIDLLPA